MTVLQESTTNRRPLISKKRRRPYKVRAERRRKERAKRQQLRLSLASDPNSHLTFAEWCALHKFSERTGRRIIKSGRGPVITWLSEKRIGISRKNDAAWVASRERV